MSLVLLAVTAALRAALCGDADWTMERRLGESTRTLVSSGTVSCAIGHGITWRVLSPFPSEVVMTTNSMIFADEEGRREKPLSELPYYDQIRSRTDAFAAGDAHAFDGLFKVSRQDTAEGGWRLGLVPEIEAMTRLFMSIEVSGARLPTNVVMRLGDGGMSVIRFREKPRGHETR